MAEFTEVIKQRNRMCERYRIGCVCNSACPMRNIVRYTCWITLIDNPEEAEALIMDWAKEHPMQTNTDKFKEVFGMELSHEGCGGVSCPDNTKCKECIYKDFWNQEYKEPKE